MPNHSSGVYNSLFCLHLLVLNVIPILISVERCRFVGLGYVQINIDFHSHDLTYLFVLHTDT